MLKGILAFIKLLEIILSLSQKFYAGYPPQSPNLQKI